MSLYLSTEMGFIVGKASRGQVAVSEFGFMAVIGNDITINLNFHM